MARSKPRPESWGAIRKLPSGRYQASYIAPDLARYNGPYTFDTKADARVWLTERRLEIQRGAWKSPQDQQAEAIEHEKRARAEKFSTYAHTWLLQRVNSKGEPLRPSTRIQYEQRLSTTLAEFADDRLSAITPARVREWHSKRLQHARTSAGVDARLLRAILNTAILDGIIDRNPVDVGLTRSMTGRKHRPPTLNELHTLLENLPSRIQLAIYLAAYGGLRLSEWRALRRRDLTIVEGRVLVNVERTAQYLDGHGWHVGPPKTAEGVRLVPLPLSLTEHVQRHLSTHVGPFPDALLFPRRVDPAEFMRDGEFNAMWNKARDAAGVRDVVREHDLRAFAGTTFAQSGATLRETMRLLGHSTTVAAMAYQHTADERMQELTDLMPLPGSTRTNLTHLNA